METAMTASETRQMESNEVLDALRDNLYIRGLRHVDAWNAQGAEVRLVKLTQEVDRLDIHALAQGLGGWREWMAGYVLLREVREDLAQFKDHRPSLGVCSAWVAAYGLLIARRIKTLCGDHHLGHLVRNLDGFQGWRADGLEWVFGLHDLRDAASSPDDWRQRVAGWEDLLGWRFDPDFFMYMTRDATWLLRVERGDWVIGNCRAMILNRSSSPSVRRVPEDWPLYSAEGLGRFIAANRAHIDRALRAARAEHMP
jgi:hypothetical protein